MVKDMETGIGVDFLIDVNIRVGIHLDVAPVIVVVILLDVTDV
jgi:hypothetical protein